VRNTSPPRYGTSQRRAGTYGRQARPQPNYAPYAVGFVFIIFALLAFLYVGLDWATGAGRVAGLGGGNRPTPTAAPAIAVPSPSAVTAPSPTVASGPERSYTVKAGDNPGSIAAQFDVSANAIMELNGITDPTKLQVGQTLRIPPAP
jgi:putative chitinase